MATSQFKIDANRENAKKSTGPKTVEGKMRSRGNAVTHGLTAMTASPGEREINLDSEREQWVETFKPQNQVALRLVDVSYQCYRRLRRNLANDDAVVARRAEKARKRFRKQWVNEADQLEQGAGTNPHNVFYELSQSFAGCSRLIRRLSELDEPLSANEWSSEHLNRLFAYQGLSVLQASEELVTLTKHYDRMNEYEAKSAHPTCGVPAPEIFAEVEAARRAWRGPGPFCVPPELEEEYEEAIEIWDAAQKNMRATFEKILEEGRTLLPKAQRVLSAAIDFAYEKLLAMRDEFKAEHEARELQEIEAAMIDTGDSGRLRHRYIVDARRDLSQSIADAEAACGIKISEARTPEIPEEPEPPAEDPTAEPSDEEVVASRNEAKSTSEDQVVCDDRADDDFRPNVLPDVPEPPDRR